MNRRHDKGVRAHARASLVGCQAISSLNMRAETLFAFAILNLGVPMRRAAPPAAKTEEQIADAHLGQSIDKGTVSARSVRAQYSTSTRLRAGIQR